ncbi:MAG: putative metalloprotease CJM1_0395 family protein [Acidobacteriota bacterium]
MTIISLSGSISSSFPSTPAPVLKGSLPDSAQPAPEGGKLTPEEEKVVKGLKARDAEVHRHEQAHLAAAGPFARGGANFEYTTGPDGKRYATGGEVNIDTSPIPSNPEKTIQKAETIKRAALAPRQPSAQDRRVAARATRMEAEARQELTDQEGEVDGYDQGGAPLSAAAASSLINLIA